ncbi:MAG: hypothetical protein HY454_04040 [Parcubacteria group bacterium]|nr:hypothetical protein [Parcubacteria group bacterium]
MSIGSFIKKRPYLIWYTKDFDSLSDEAVVEAVLNYGEWDDIQKLIRILGIKKTAQIFYKQARQKRSNYRKKSRNFFALYFKRHNYA